MEQPSSPRGILPSRAESVIDVLQANGASLFGKALYDHGMLKRMIDEGKIKVILAPVDAAVQAFLAAFSQSVAAFGTTSAGRDILENHFSSMDGENTASIQSINKQTLLLDTNTIRNHYKFQRITDVAGVSILFISLVLFTAEQIKKWQLPRTPGLKSALTADGLTAVIQLGGIKGRDLINLCNTNFEAKEFCNRRDVSTGETLFHRLLRTEFQVSLGSEEDAREAYIFHHSTVNGFFTHPDGDAHVTSFRPHPTIPNDFVEEQLPGFWIPDGPYLQIVNVDMNFYCLTRDLHLRKFKIYQSLMHDGMRNRVMEFPVKGLPENYRIRKMSSERSFPIIWGYDGEIYLEQGTMQGQTFLKLSRGNSTVLDLSSDWVLMDQPSLKLRFKKPIRKPTLPDRTTLDIDHADDRHTIVDPDTKLISPFGQTMRREENMTILRHITRKSERSYDLSNFPAGSFQPSFKKIFWDDNNIWVLNDAGELWTHRVASKTRIWTKIRHPLASKFTEFLALLALQNSDYPTVVIDDQGGIFQPVDKEDLKLEHLVSVKGLVGLSIVPILMPIFGVNRALLLFNA